MNLGARKLTKKEAVDLILQEPNLLRRPLVLSGKKAALGFDPGRYDEIF
jgi:arsenate reductase-like glutaredoxin family protein